MHVTKADVLPELGKGRCSGSEEPLCHQQMAAVLLACFFNWIQRVAVDLCTFQCRAARSASLVCLF